MNALGQAIAILDADGGESSTKPTPVQRVLATIEKKAAVLPTNQFVAPYSEEELKVEVEHWRKKFLSKIESDVNDLGRTNPTKFKRAADELSKIKEDYQDTIDDSDSPQNARLYQISRLVKLYHEMRAQPQPALEQHDIKSWDFSLSVEDIEQAVSAISELKKLIPKVERFIPNYGWELSMSPAEAIAALEEARIYGKRMIGGARKVRAVDGQRKWRSNYELQVRAIEDEVIRLLFAEAKDRAKRDDLKHARKWYHSSAKKANAQEKAKKQAELWGARNFILIDDFDLDYRRSNVAARLNRALEIVDKINDRSERSLAKAQISDRTRRRYQI